MPIDANKRLGLSYISPITDFENIYNEEILMDKTTGIIYIKTPENGDIISYNYHTRLANHIAKLSMGAYDNSLGKECRLYQIDPDGLELPANVPINSNLVSGEMYLYGGSSKFVLSIDMDCFSSSEGGIIQKYNHDIPLTYTFNTYHNGQFIASHTDTIFVTSIADNPISVDEVFDMIEFTELILGTPENVENPVFVVHSICALLELNNHFPVVKLNVLHQHTRELIVGEVFDTEGLVVEAVTSEDDHFECTDYTYTIYKDGELVPNEFIDSGIHTIIISRGIISTSYDFEVINPVIVKLEVIEKPYKMTYEVGDEFNPEGLVALGTYDNGRTEIIEDYEVTGFNSSEPTDRCTLTLNKDSCYATLDIKVIPKLYMYTVDSNNDVTLIRYFGYDEHIVVPETRAGNPVKYIAETCFTNTNITYIDIPEGVLYIK